MDQQFCTILENRPLTDLVWTMKLRAHTKSITAPGQFVNLKLDGLYLRRPISICDWDLSTITLIYKVVGDGTRQMSLLPTGTKLDLLTGLGNGFSVEDCGSRPLLVGGGVGVPPLYGLAKQLVPEEKKPVVVMGFQSAEDVFYVREFEELGCQVEVATVDGTMGTKGFVTDVIREKGLEYTDFCACGPIPMLKALSAACPTGGQLSFEERMGCGFGACMGCSCQTKYGNKRICKDGPVLKKEEVIW